MTAGAPIVEILLDPSLRPSVPVGRSTEPSVAEMREVRAWCRDHGIPYVSVRVADDLLRRLAAIRAAEGGKREEVPTDIPLYAGSPPSEPQPDERWGELRASVNGRMQAEAVSEDRAMRDRRELSAERHRQWVRALEFAISEIDRLAPGARGERYPAIVVSKARATRVGRDEPQHDELHLVLRVNGLPRPVWEALRAEAFGSSFPSRVILTVPEGGAS